jgi:hypothetical protein
MTNCDRYPWWRLPFPRTVSRAILDSAAGVDSRFQSECQNLTPADIGLASQKHNYVIEDYLSRLGKGGERQ